MAEFSALEALTAPVPTDRQWVIRIAAELICTRHMLDGQHSEVIVARAAAVIGAGMLCTDAPYYLAELTPTGWARLTVDILICAQWAEREQWSF